MKAETVRQEEDPNRSKTGTESPNDRQWAVTAFALDEGRRGLTHQQSELDRHRQRALSQLGYTTAVATFVVNGVLEFDTGSSLIIAMIGATLLAALLLVATFRIWQPVEEWRIKIAPRFIFDNYATTPTMDALKDLVSHYDNARESNEGILEAKRRQFQHSSIASGSLIVWLLGSLWVLR